MAKLYKVLTELDVVEKGDEYSFNDETWYLLPSSYKSAKEISLRHPGIRIRRTYKTSSRLEYLTQEMFNGR